METQNPNQMEPTSVQSTPKKSKKTLLIIIGVVFVLAVAGLGIAFNQGWLFKGDLQYLQYKPELLDPCLGLNANNNCLYVDLAADPNLADGTIQHPYITITDALKKIDKTKTNYIRVAGSGKQYVNENFPLMVDTLPNPVNFQGGYSKDFSTRDTQLNQTVVQAAPGTTIFFINNSSALVDGFTLGQADNVAIRVQNGGAPQPATVKIMRNIFMDNNGGAIDINSPNQDKVQVGLNTFQDNKTGMADLIRSFGNVMIANNVFATNDASNLIDCTSSNNDAKVENNYFLGNMSPELKASLVKLNGGCSFVHNTLDHNSLTGANGSLVIIAGANNVAVNNLISNNTSSGVVDHPAGDSSFSHNAVFNNTPDYQLPDGFNNFKCDPGFKSVTSVDPVDFKLQASASSCIDKAGTVGTINSDYFLTDRPQDGNGDGASEPDPGAYEAPAPAKMAVCSGITLSPKTVAVGDNNYTVNVMFDDGQSYQTTLVWTPSNTSGKFDFGTTVDLSANPQTNVFHATAADAGFTVKVNSVQGANNTSVCQTGITVKAAAPAAVASCSGITVTPQALNASGATALSATVQYDDGKVHASGVQWSVTNGTLDKTTDSQNSNAVPFTNVFHPAQGATSASVTIKASPADPGVNNSKVCQTGFTVNMPVVNTPPDSTCGGFTDVAPSDSELCPLATEMKQAGLFTGTTFRAKDAVARYEAALMIVRALHLPAKDCSAADVSSNLKKFSDLDLSASYISELCLANGINVITGYKVTPPVMYPAHQVTYRELFKMVYNGYVILGHGASPRLYSQVADLFGFAVNDYNSWFGYPLQFLANQGLYTLNQLKQVSLDSPMTRLQIAKVMHLILHKGQLTF